MKRLGALFIFLALGGCAQFGSVTDVVRGRGAEVADKEIETALFILCKGVTVGAWVRKFGNNEEAAQAWKTMCIEQAVVTPVQIK